VVVSVAREECRIEGSNGLQHHYVVADGSVKGSAPVFPAVTKDRIFLSNAAGLPEFRLPFDFLAGLGSTEPTPPSVHWAVQRLNRLSRSLDPATEYSGLAVRVRALIRNQPDRLEIIQQYLRAIAPPFDRIDVIESNEMLWLRFIEKAHSGESMPFSISQAVLFVFVRFF
jgi:hypothetical protein